MSLGLDLSQAQEQGDPVPDGQYLVSVVKAEVVDTKAGGQMIKLQHKIAEGQPQQGRIVFDNFNIKNANPQATQIGLGQLKTMLKAFGHPNPNRLESTNELLGLKGLINVKVEADPGYGPQSRVKRYSKTDGQPANAAPGATVAQVTAQAKSPFG